MLMTDNNLNHQLSTAAQLISEKKIIFFLASGHDYGESAAALLASIHFFESRSVRVFGTIFGNNHQHLNFIQAHPEKILNTEQAKVFFQQEPHTEILVVICGAITPVELTSIFGTPEPSIPHIFIRRHEQPTTKNATYLTSTSASSIGEITYHLLRHIDTEPLHPTSATALLTSIIIATKSFRSGTINPEVLALASTLVAQGANREMIIHHLYRSRSLATLRLWGIALSRLNHRSHGLVTTSLTHQDILASGADSNEIYGVADELLSNAPEAKISLILYEKKSPTPVVSGILSSEHQGISCLNLSQQLGGWGNERRTVFETPYSSVSEAEKAIITNLVHQLEQQPQQHTT
jgi:nanoRNase/pAp phosphatase (c-di-AMP/oligoRNAs hydrolase)